MEPDDLPDALDRFARDLTVAGEPAVFDVVVARHLPLLLELRRAGLRWPAVLRLLSRAGARRPNGAELSSDQLRASISRAKRGRGNRSAPVEPPLASSRPPGSKPSALASTGVVPRTHIPPATPPLGESAAATFTPLVRAPEPTGDPDLTAAELDAARRRLR